MRETDFFGRLLLVGLALGAGVGLGLLIAPARGDLTRERLSASARSAAGPAARSALASSSGIGTLSCHICCVELKGIM